MPFRQDFTELSSKGEVEINPAGWTKLTVEYGYNYVGNVLNLFWRVKDTQHTFRIPFALLNQLSSGNYEKHFEYVLENFRQEYLSWAAQGFPSEWMVEYHREYRNFLQL